MAHDISLDEKLDLKIINHDLDFSLSDDTHIELILLSEKGHFKETPVLGVGVKKYLNSPTTHFKRAIVKDLTIQLEADGAQNIDVEFTVDSIVVNADY